MGKITGIAWTDHTFNAWWGCQEVLGSPACGAGAGPFGGECYAKTLDRRLGGDHWGNEKGRRFFSDRYWNEPLRWNREAERTQQRRRVFCMSMGDWAEGRADQQESLKRLWELIARTTWLDWLMLTKRPQLIPRLYPEEWQRDPPENVWLGCTAETQRWMDIRWPLLRRVEAAVHWFSIEPMFEPIVLPEDFLARANRAWCITGGQSGLDAQPMNPSWYRSVNEQCRKAGVPHFFKQHGEWIHESQLTGQKVAGAPESRHEDGTLSYRIGKKAAGHLLDDSEIQEFPLGRVAAGREVELLEVIG